jgi:hypothetical protein
MRKKIKPPTIVIHSNACRIEEIGILSFSGGSNDGVSS